MIKESFDMSKDIILQLSIFLMLLNEQNFRLLVHFFALFTKCIHQVDILRYDIVDIQ